MVSAVPNRVATNAIWLQLGQVKEQPTSKYGHMLPIQKPGALSKSLLMRPYVNHILLDCVGAALHHLLVRSTSTSISFRTQSCATRTRIQPIIKPIRCECSLFVRLLCLLHSLVAGKSGIVHKASRLRDTCAMFVSSRCRPTSLCKRSEATVYLSIIMN